MVGWKMFTWKVEKSFTNVGGNLIAKWGVEPNNVAFSVAARFRIRRFWVNIFVINKTQLHTTTDCSTP